jgi:hypothetical protein
MPLWISFRPIFFLIAFLSALLLLGGCGDDRPDMLALEIDGKTVELKLEKMDIYLVDPAHQAEFPESFEIVGPDVILCGEFPKSTRVGHEAKYDVLRGTNVAITKANADVREPKRSSLTLPESGPTTVEGGSLVVDQIGQGDDARTPLSGKVQLRLKTPSGERTVNGTFKVKGTTWG